MARKTINQLTELDKAEASDKVALYDNSTNTTKKISMSNLFSSGFDVYSTSEVKTNKIWINGKPIYRKVVECGTLPNNTTKTVNVNIANIGDVVNLIGFATSSTGSTITLPYIYDASTYIEFYFSKTNLNVIIKSSFDASIYYTTSYAILEYTKTTD